LTDAASAALAETGSPRTRERAILLISTLNRSAGLVPFESGEIWARIAALRPPINPLDPAARATALAAMRRLMNADAAQRETTEPGWPDRIAAYEAAGRASPSACYHPMHRRGGSTNGSTRPGQYHDVETGLYYDFHRYYDPAVGRYQSADPLGLAPQPNAYVYVANPTLHIDPLGLAPCRIHGNDSLPDLHIALGRVGTEENPNALFDFAERVKATTCCDLPGKWTRAIRRVGGVPATALT
jgi:RHS repeat-associated protein